MTWAGVSKQKLIGRSYFLKNKKMVKRFSNFCICTVWKNWLKFHVNKKNRKKIEKRVSIFEFFAYVLYRAKKIERRGMNILNDQTGECRIRSPCK